MTKEIIGFSIVALPFIALFVYIAIYFWQLAAAIVGAIVWYGLCIWAVHVICGD